MYDTRMRNAARRAGLKKNQRTCKVVIYDPAVGPIKPEGNWDTIIYLPDNGRDKKPEATPCPSL